MGSEILLIESFDFAHFALAVLLQHKSFVFQKTAFEDANTSSHIDPFDLMLIAQPVHLPD